MEQLGDTIDLDEPYAEETLELEPVAEVGSEDSGVLVQPEPLEAEPSSHPESDRSVVDVFPPLPSDVAGNGLGGRESGLHFSARRASPPPDAEPASFTPREDPARSSFLDALDVSLKLEL